MSDLIDREAVIRVMDEMDDLPITFKSRHADSEYIDGWRAACGEAADAIRSLPAAVPVCDVEKARGDYLWLTSGEVANVLTAGYVGAVDAGDVRLVAEALVEIHTGHPQPPQPDEIAAAKRLLTVVKGK